MTLASPESVDCHITDDGVYVSLACPGRAAKECLFGWALYQMVGIKITSGETIGQVSAAHVGAGDQDAAYKWLSGKPKEECGIINVYAN